MCKQIDFLYTESYTRIRRAFTVFGLLLTEPFLHKRGTFDSCNQYLNCILKKMYCVLFLHIHQMNGCEHSGDTAVHLRDTAVMAWLDYCIHAHKVGLTLLPRAADDSLMTTPMS